MKRTIAVLMCCVVVTAAVTLTGCGKDESSTTVKTMEEHRDEAAKQINEKNVDAELEKITREIESDLKSGE